MNRDAPDDAYIPEPFPEDEFKPIEWRGILATLDVCVNETTPTVFCNEEGYDVIPICMIKVNHKNGDPEDKIQGQEVPKSGTTIEEQEELDVAIRCLGLQDEISIRDLSEDEDEEVKDQVFYDASDKLEDFDKDLAEVVKKRLQLRDNREVLLPPGNMMNGNKKNRQKRQGHTKGQRTREVPRIKDKTTYLRLVNAANDCVKDKITGCYLTQKTQWETRSRKTKNQNGENTRTT